VGVAEGLAVGLGVGEAVGLDVEPVLEYAFPWAEATDPSIYTPSMDSPIFNATTTSVIISFFISRETSSR
jgi:hypothetical protein